MSDYAVIRNAHASLTVDLNWFIHSSHRFKSKWEVVLIKNYGGSNCGKTGNTRT